jgi:hypothetical protein
MSLSGKIKLNSHVLFSISIIQDEHQEAQTGVEFDRMANDLINEPNVNKVTLLKADSLQRFRLMLKHNISEDEAIIKAKELSDQFEKDNHEKIEELKKTKKLEIIDWDYYSHRPEFKEKLKDIEALYETDRNFMQEVNNLLANRTRKLKSELGETYNHERACNLMKKYIFEEVTFQIIAGQDDKADFHYELYKSERNKAMRYAHNKFVKNQKVDRMSEIHYLSPEKVYIKAKTEEKTYSSDVNPMMFFAPLFGDKVDPQVLSMTASIYHLLKGTADMLLQQGKMSNVEIMSFLLTEHIKFMSELQCKCRQEERTANLGEEELQIPVPFLHKEQGSHSPNVTKQ